jgi:hypothetical protein
MWAKRLDNIINAWVSFGPMQLVVAPCPFLVLRLGIMKLCNEF